MPLFDQAIALDGLTVLLGGHTARMAQWSAHPMPFSPRCDVKRVGARHSGPRGKESAAMREQTQGIPGFFGN